MTHWHRAPKPIQVGRLLFHEKRKFLIDRVSVADILEHSPCDPSSTDQVFPDQHLSRGEVVARCQKQRRILITADTEFAALLFSEDRAPWGVLLLPVSANGQLETIKRLSAGSLVFHVWETGTAFTDFVRRNRLLVDVRGEQPSFNVYCRCRWK
jgi:hypothetical protein